VSEAGAIPIKHALADHRLPFDQAVATAHRQDAVADGQPVAAE
jgi:hypothetical protein